MTPHGRFLAITQPSINRAGCPASYLRADNDDGMMIVAAMMSAMMSNDNHLTRGH
jgi:hypothetical protein